MCVLSLDARREAGLRDASEATPEAAAPEVARPAVIQQVGLADAGAKLRFPGRLRAAQPALRRIYVELASPDDARAIAAAVA